MKHFAFSTVKCSQFAGVAVTTSLQVDVKEWSVLSLLLAHIGRHLSRTYHTA